MTSISWLLIYLQLDFDLKNFSKNNGSLNKMQNLSLANSEVLRNSMLTNIHRTNDFIQTFSSAVRVNISVLKL